MRLAGAFCAVLAMLALWWARIEVFSNGRVVLKHGIAVVGVRGTYRIDCG